jgi:hypothetical protein
MKRVDLGQPATRAGLQALLERPDVYAVQIEKGAPVRLGVQRHLGGAFVWFSGGSLFGALLNAQDTLDPKPQTEPRSLR